MKLGIPYMNFIKQENQDFELYPTTDEIIYEFYFDLILNMESRERFSLLDIGAGTGKIFTKLEEINEKNIKNNDNLPENFYSSDFWQENPQFYNFKYIIRNFTIEKYAIEKSRVLIQNMPDNIAIIGTDFETQSLIDKEVDVTFCNPPYSAYKFWMTKVLKESCSEKIYFVVPRRWINSKEIQQVLTDRNISYSILGEFSFEKAEDRRARAIVNLVKFNLNKAQNAFDFWFDENFKINADNFKLNDYGQKTKKERIENELINKKDIISEFIKLYQRDLINLLKNYKALEELDYEIFDELGIELSNVKKGLKFKINNLKKLYWNMLFDRLEAITSRLTKTYRDRIFDKLSNRTNIDFTENNIYSVLIWIVKNYNLYFDKQISDFYFRLSDRDNIVLYKSNKKFVEDGWRYNKREMTHYALDYRIITHSYNNFGGYEFEKQNGLGENAINLMSDIFTIAQNLNFSVNFSDIYNNSYEPGTPYFFYYQDKNGDNKEFMKIKFFKKDSVHINFCQKFIKKLNIEASRINGWIKKPEDAVKEFDVTQEEAQEMFGGLFKLDIKTSVKLVA